MTDQPSKVEQPAHVPDELVVDFDMFADPGLSVDPHARVFELVCTTPSIFWTPRNGGHWVLMSHEANYQAGRKPELFSSQIIPPEMQAAMQARLPAGAPRIPTLVPIFLDPPDHARYRMPLASAFSPKTMTALQESIRTQARALIQGVVRAGECEFMSAIAVPLPVHVFMKMMGFPLERDKEYRALAREVIGGAGDAPEVVLQRMFRIVAAMRDTLLARKAQPEDDLITLLWSLKIGDRPTTLADVEDFALLLFLAGLDTVMLGMGFAARHLATHADLQQQLRDHPDQITKAKEEMLRRYSFVSPPRRVAQDSQFNGVQLKKNERVVQFLPAAGLDSARFPDPERFDIERTNTGHIAFNSGAHRCLGSNLARTELQVFYEELLSILPPFRLDTTRPPVFHGGNNLGITSMYLLWDAPAAA
jgi:cytochrome P450